MKICLCFGGPSDERNISAGSLKPWLSWLAAAPEVALEVLYFDRHSQAWRLPEKYRHTNTCEDFESQLAAEAKLTDEGLDEFLRQQDVVVPLIHGAFGEDGELQQRLERLGLAYTFSAPAALALTMDKAACYGALEAVGLPVPEHFVFSREEWQADPQEILARARDLESLNHPAGPPEAPSLAIKPVQGGSSLGVSLATSRGSDFGEAVASALEHDQAVLCERRLEGTEFSVIVLETDRGPVALVPTEVEKQGTLFDTRSKYLHGEGARLHTPLGDEGALKNLRAAALAAWRATGLRDMARIDGFLEPTGRIWVTDINSISGMGFSSFGFLQTAMCGFSHGDLIGHLLGRTAQRAGLAPLRTLPGARGPGNPEEIRGRVVVILGGPTSERQVSRQSGIFVGLSLLSLGYCVRFVLMDSDCHFTEIGLFYSLHHDVEEIRTLVEAPARRMRIEALARELGAELGLDPLRACAHLTVGPRSSLAEVVQEADFVFLALHGGPGEDGRLQTALEALQKPYNGCGPEASRLSSDKRLAVERVANLRLEGIATPRQREVTLFELAAWRKQGNWRTRYLSLREELGADALVGKPASDGCSTGVKLLTDEHQLEAFVDAIVKLMPELPAGTLGPNSRVLKFPLPSPDRWLFERALCDLGAEPLPAGDLNAAHLHDWLAAQRFLELTCAVIEDPQSRKMRVATPSLALARAGELSLEEKFQQGVGTNLELDAFLGPVRVRTIQKRVASLSAALGLEGYGRIDCFYDTREDLIYLLECNTLCGLTEATVFYSQVASSFGLSPPEALEWILCAGRQRNLDQAASASSGIRTAITSMQAR
jgi:D-alanine--D-alanine ligase